MNTHQIQLKISLSPQLNDLLASKAASLGIPVTQLVKYLIIKDVEKERYPVFQASKKLEEITKRALKNRDKAVEVVDAHDFFKNL